MTDPEFSTQLAIIRSTTDIILKTGDFSQNHKIEEAWKQIKAAGRELEATTIFQVEALDEMDGYYNELQEVTGTND